MRKAKTYAGVKKATTLRNDSQAKKLALLRIVKTDYEYENTWIICLFMLFKLICVLLLKGKYRRGRK